MDVFTVKEIVDRVLDKQDEIVREVKNTRETLAKGLADIANVQTTLANLNEHSHGLEARVHKLELSAKRDSKDDAALRKAKLVLYGKLGGVCAAAVTLITILVETVR